MISNHLGYQKKVNQVNIRYNIGRIKSKSQFEKIGIFFIFILFLVQFAYADMILTASWYSISSLHRDGQWKLTHGRCADGSYFRDNVFTCATNLFPLGTLLRITVSSDSSKSVSVVVTDRINKRFAKTRIDLSKGAFQILAPLSKGLIQVSVERIK